MTLSLRHALKLQIFCSFHIVYPKNLLQENRFRIKTKKKLRAPNEAKADELQRRGSKNRKKFCVWKNKEKEKKCFGNFWLHVTQFRSELEAKRISLRRFSTTFSFRMKWMRRKGKKRNYSSCFLLLSSILNGIFPIPFHILLITKMSFKMK